MSQPLTPMEKLLLSDLRLNTTAAVLKHVAAELSKDETREKLTKARRHVEKAQAMLSEVLDSADEPRMRHR